MVGQTQECERAWVGDFDCPTGCLILRHFPAKISNSILMIFLSSVVARWGPKSAQIEKCKVETLLVGPFHIGFKGKKWVLGVFSMSHPNRSGLSLCMCMFRSKSQFVSLKSRSKTACQSDVSHCQARCFPPLFE